jgi:hypothetical protein
MPCIAFLKAGHSVQDAGVTNAMSALGQKRTLNRLHPMSALPPKADMTRFHIDVPESGYSALIESITC